MSNWHVGQFAVVIGGAAKYELAEIKIEDFERAYLKAEA